MNYVTLFCMKAYETFSLCIFSYQPHHSFNFISPSDHNTTSNTGDGIATEMEGNLHTNAKHHHHHKEA